MYKHVYHSIIFHIKKYKQLRGQYREGQKFFQKKWSKIKDQSEEDGLSRLIL